jgi:hypothetical protein
MDPGTGAEHTNYGILLPSGRPSGGPPIPVAGDPTLFILWATFNAFQPPYERLAPPWGRAAGQAATSSKQADLGLCLWLADMDLAAGAMKKTPPQKQKSFWLSHPKGQDMGFVPATLP